ncbi:hypothetical protein GDO78_020830 [Eleutherodactylus coqui]|uniref:Uncharacterized protein n=1 Tax=Eleutherodactylus coqui TaxID=57060 RepID=A0A8J6E2W0_ELECQ|nr:hypothetical protein GDO78_020830 [Eleutherodactylus coqui]
MTERNGNANTDVNGGDGPAWLRPGVCHCGNPRQNLRLNFDIELLAELKELSGFPDNIPLQGPLWSHDKGSGTYPSSTTVIQRRRPLGACCIRGQQKSPDCRSATAHRPGSSAHILGTMMPELQDSGL